MHVIRTRNVHEALPEAALVFESHAVSRSSRVGDVFQLPMPLTTAYGLPQERVMFWRARDANPFFHLYESFWMLNGQNTVEDLAWWNSGISQYSDNGETFNGAYGFRWRKHFGGDQLDTIIGTLSENPNCRRQVLAHWDARVDLGSGSKDIPCNTHVYFQQNPRTQQLDMMVCNRSNDLVWGAYGANAVHFSCLHEYVAHGVGMPMGTYYHTSFNTHYYVDPHASLMKAMSAAAPNPESTAVMANSPYSRGEFGALVPLCSIPRGRWDRELSELMAAGPVRCGTLTDPMLEHVLRPAWNAYTAFKLKDFALVADHLKAVAAPDWQLAMREWMDRRETAWKEKQS